MDVNTQDSDWNDRTPLHWACMKGRGDIVQLLLDNKADVNARNDWRQTPLHRSVWRNNAETISLLVARGADIEAKTNDGETPLTYAIREMRVISTEELVKLGASVEKAKDSNYRQESFEWKMSNTDIFFHTNDFLIF